VQKPRPPELAEVRAYPRGAGEVLVLGRVRAAGAAWVKLRSGATERVLRVDRSGRFHAELAAPAGAQLLLESLGPTRRESEFVPLCTVPAMLECARGAALVRGLPHQAFLLVAESQGRVLRCWRGETDAGGTRRVPLDILGGPPGAGLTLRAVVGVAGVLQSSPVIVPGA
ncbi:MAG: hypothetical protein KDC87_21645, partial [Planctomycetes bacterium]|nr:hypothetical protein [Planctomycetota bacterium]